MIELREDRLIITWRVPALAALECKAREVREGLRALPLLIRRALPDRSARRRELRARAELLLREAELRALRERLAEEEARARQGQEAPAAPNESPGDWWDERLAPPEEEPVWVGDPGTAWEETAAAGEETDQAGAVEIDGDAFPLDDPEAIGLARQRLIDREISWMLAELRQVEVIQGGLADGGFGERVRWGTTSTRHEWAPWLQRVAGMGGVKEARRVVERAVSRQKGAVYERLVAEAVARLAGESPRPGEPWAEPAPEWQALVTADARAPVPA